VAVDPRERELLAQLLGVAVVRLDIDRALEEERFIQTVQLVLNSLRRAFGVRQFAQLLSATSRSAGRIP
jgi:hypothetical protein